MPTPNVQYAVTNILFDSVFSLVMCPRTQPSVDNGGRRLQTLLCGWVAQFWGLVAIYHFAEFFDGFVGEPDVLR